MKTDKNTPKTREIAQILYIFNALRLKNAVKSQKNYAEMLGIDQNTLSGVLNGNPKFNAENLLKKSLALAAEHGIEVSASNNSQALNVGDNFGEQKILGTDNARWFDLCAEKDRQIDRLLTIIEKMQS